MTSNRDSDAPAPFAPARPGGQQALRIPAPRRERMRWLRALRALRELLATPDDTQKAMDLHLAIGARDFERSFQRFIADPTGRRLLEARASLAAALADREALSCMPDDSLGRAYLDYLDHNGFEPRALIELQHAVHARWEEEEGAPPLDPVRWWFHERFTLEHDLFHVLTDYGTDGVGEATLLAFSLAQGGGRANALLTFGAAWEMWRVLGFPWLRYDLRAWQRGRRADWLIALPWEELLPLPLDTVRALAHLEPAAIAHPGGILRGEIDEDRVFVAA